MKQIVPFFTFFLLFIQISLQAQNNKSLYDICRLQSGSLLDEYLQDWHESLKPYTPDRITDNTVREVYAIFYVLYKPYTFKNHFQGEDYSLLNKTITYKPGYFTIQNKIIYWQSDLEALQLESFDYTVKSENPGSIKDFRPQLGDTSIIPLYLTNHYIEELEHVFDYYGYEQDNLVETYVDREERLKQYSAFICKKIPFTKLGDDDDPVFFESLFKVNKMIFNRNATECWVEFAYEYYGGAAVLKKINGNWIIMHIELLWV